MLQVKDLTVQFGGLTAVDHVSFEVKRNQIVSLIGPNGAGKTTCFNAITGFCHVTHGEVSLSGEPLTGLMPHQIAKKKISRTFQKTTVFDTISVLENLVTASHLSFRSGFWQILFSLPSVKKEERAFRKHGMEILELCGLADKAHTVAQNLSYGEGRLLEIAIALAVKPDVLLLDEPAAGLNPSETQEMIALIKKIRDVGNTVLLVEHDMSLVMSISDHIEVINFGKKIASGSPDEIAANPEVIEAYLGTRDLNPGAPGEN
ncbi:MAG: ABC transporter ATP-binding protein [Deltaproteobacteria bacterium]|nr:MAG: ABC transporter ATP-binding protein [Deltaproteobacteria bacterium]